MLHVSLRVEESSFSSHSHLHVILSASFYVYICPICYLLLFEAQPGFSSLFHAFTTTSSLFLSASAGMILLLAPHLLQHRLLPLVIPLLLLHPLPWLP